MAYAILPCDARCTIIVNRKLTGELLFLIINYLIIKTILYLSCLITIIGKVLRRECMGIASVRSVKSFEQLQDIFFYCNDYSAKQNDVTTLDFFTDRDVILHSEPLIHSKFELEQPIKLAFFNLSKKAEKKYQKTGDKLNQLIQELKKNNNNNTTINIAPQQPTQTMPIEQPVTIPQITDKEKEKILDDISDYNRSPSKINEGDGWIMIGNTKVQVK